MGILASSPLTANTIFFQSSGHLFFYFSGDRPQYSLQAFQKSKSYLELYSVRTSSQTAGNNYRLSFSTVLSIWDNQSFTDPGSADVSLEKLLSILTIAGSKGRQPSLQWIMSPLV